MSQSDIVQKDTNEEDLKKRKSFLEKFYSLYKDNSHVLSKGEIINKYNKKGLFTQNIWYKNNLIGILTNKGDIHSSRLIFGFKSGLFFHDDKLTVIKGEPGSQYHFTIPLDKIIEEFYFSFKENVINIYYDGSKEYKRCSPEEKEIILELVKEWKIKYNIDKSTKEDIQKEIFENILKSKSSLISDLYHSLNIGETGDLVLENLSDLSKILQNNQKKIIDIDKIYVQKFVRITNYLSEKKSNILSIFNSLRELWNNQNEQISYFKSLIDFQDNFHGKENVKEMLDDKLNENINLIKGLKNQIHTYDLLLVHSINMITSLIDDNLIVFYEIYECIDKLGIFNSSWENEVSNKLSNIEENLIDLVYSINKMENNIVNSVKKLTYITQESFKDLTFSVNKQLSSIDSTMKFNNLLTLVQTYQVYKINENTKRLK